MASWMPQTRGQWDRTPSNGCTWQSMARAMSAGKDIRAMTSRKMEALVKICVLSTL